MSNMRFYRRRLFLFVLLVVLGGGIVTVSLLTDLDVEGDFIQPWLFGRHNSSHAGEIACYYYNYNNDNDNDNENAEGGAPRIVNHLKELNSASVPLGTSIFFHETSCHLRFSPLLTARQACAVESAAKMNPDSQVYVLFPSPVTAKNYTTDMYVRQLKSYSNVHLRHINMERYFEHSPLESWYKSGYLLTSQWPGSHASDLLRYLTLWNFGGIYLDLDVVVVKSLKGLTNFAGAESDSAVAAGVMSFSNNKTGKYFATSCLNDLKENFRGYDWGNNGPGVITRVLKKVCKVKNVKDMIPERCRGFQVYPPSWFYPISWKEWYLYFDVNANKTVMEKLKKSHIIHVWNKFSSNTSVNVGSNQPYGVIAEHFCPKVYSNTKNVF